MNMTVDMIEKPCFVYNQIKNITNLLEWDMLKSKPYILLNDSVFVNGDYFSETNPRSYSRVDLMIDF